MKKINKIISIVLCSAIVLMLTSCDGGLFKKPDDIAVARNFLTVYCTSDLDGRYTRYASYDDFDDVDAYKAHIKEFYSGVKKLVTDDCYEKLLRTGRMFSEDEAAYKEGVSTHPENIEISEYSTLDSGRYYSFSLDLVRTGEVNETVKIVGQIGVSNGKITNIYARYG